MGQWVLISEGPYNMGSKTTGGSHYKPGQSAPYSGQYAELGPRGGNTGREVTGVKGKTLPPTQGRPGRPEAAILAKLKNVVGTSAN